MSSRDRRDQKGAVAVVFAVCALMLFAFAAVGVDLGNAMNRKKQVQTDADLAALAGGGSLPAPSTVPTSADPVVQAVATYLIANRVSDDAGNALPSQSVLAQKLVSTSAADKLRYGHVYYGYYDTSGFHADKNYVTVTTPRSQVNFGVARAIGMHDTSVGARATAGIFSPGAINATLPFYAYTGCDWGQQIVNHATANATAPALYAPSDNNGVSLTAPSTLAPNVNPQQVAVNDTTTTITLTGTGLTKSATPATPGSAGIVAVGLFTAGGAAPTEIAAGSFLGGSNATQIQFTVPASVASVDGVTYYVRVAKWVNTGNAAHPAWVKQWSAVSTTMPYLQVGSATLFCNDDKSAGNFGTLSIFRLDSTNNQSTGWLPLNVALGLDQPNVQLNLYPTPIGANACDNGDAKAYQSDASASGTHVNCLVTDTGFAQNSATNGFLTGVSGTPGAPGRLTSTTALSKGCGGVNGAPALRTYASHQINNDVLTCFFTDNNTTVSQISSSGYSGNVVIDPSIYSSPRFFYIPVINKQPANGKKSYPIVDFRPAFITGENGSAKRGHGNDPAAYYDNSDVNGLTLTGNNWNSVKVDAFRVVMINPKALPPNPGAGKPQSYGGSGVKLLLMTD